MKSKISKEANKDIKEDYETVIESLDSGSLSDDFDIDDRELLEGVEYYQKRAVLNKSFRDNSYAKFKLRGKNNEVLNVNFPLDQLYKTAKAKLLFEGKKSISAELRQ